MDQRLEAALVDLVAAREAAAEAKERWEAAKATHDDSRFAVRDMLAEFAAEALVTGERIVDLDDARTLYWDYSDVHVGWIAPCLGVKKSEVYKIIGGRPALRVTCHECGRFLRMEKPSRAGTGDRHERCDRCIEERQARWDAARRARWEAERPAREQYRRERLAAINGGGYWINFQGEVILPGQGVPDGFHRRGYPDWDSCPGVHRIVGGIDAWMDGGRVAFKCPACGDEVHEELVRYVPAVESLPMSEVPTSASGS